MTAEEVEDSGLRVKIRALEKKCCSASVEIPGDMSSFIALAEQSLDSKSLVAMLEQAIIGVERKLQIPSSAAISAQHSAFANAEVARKCSGKVKDVEERLIVAQIVVN